MPPPAFGKGEARPKSKGTAGTQRSLDSFFNKDENRVHKPAPKPQPRIDFSKFPAEIQHMIWSEAIQKPACHTFKFVKRPERRATARGWDMELHVHQDNLDTSAYRQWKTMLFNRQYKIPYDIEWRVNMKAQSASSKLANASFQTGFRRAMIDFQAFEVYASYRGGRVEQAAIDTATDLTILEFERGLNAPALHWFEHSTGLLRIKDLRDHVRHLKRVAVHYKKSHKNCTSRGPFQCFCPSGADLDCGLYKACPVEQACFLDSFPNLKEFYYVVEVTKKKELEWKDEYRDHVRKQGYKMKTSKDSSSAPFELQRFYDTKYEYIQLCPESFFPFLPSKLRLSKAVPLDAVVEGGPRECLTKVRDVYKGKIGNETFMNSAEERKKVKFGILFAYSISPLPVPWKIDINHLSDAELSHRSNSVKGAKD